jgi:1,4-dihydroxy-2-naphtoate prenyltransferase (EC 2.5.1.-)
MANDLGDYQQGTDITGERIGPQRTVQSGAISPEEMTKAIKNSYSMCYCDRNIACLCCSSVYGSGNIFYSF